MVIVLLSALALLSLFAYITRPERLARLTSELLTDMTGAHVRIESARFGIDGTIQLGRVEMSVPGLDPQAGRLFDAHQVMVKHNLLSLAGGRFSPRSLTFVHPILYHTEILDAGKFNYELLKKDDDEDMQLPERLPELFIRGGQILFAEHDPSQHTVLGKLLLEGRLFESIEQDDAYFFNLRQQLPKGETGPTLRGSFDLKNRRVAGKLERFFIQGPQRNILPRRMRTWWDQLQPAGSFPTVQVGYDPDPEIGFHAVLELHQVALTLPYLEANARMTVETGKITVAREIITFHDLIGQVEDFRYQINGRVRGFSMDAPLAMSAKIRGRIPDQPRYLPALPLGVQKTFNRFTPAGRFTALVMVDRVRAGADLRYDGRVELADAQILDARFPYPLDNVQGELRFDNEKVQLVALHGVGPTGAKAVVRGTIAPPGPGAAVDVTVNGMNLPIDDVLMAALKPQQRKFVKTLLDEQAYARLIDPDEGIVMSSRQRQEWSDALTKQKTERHRLESAKEVDEQALLACNELIDRLTGRLTRPVFDLGGTVTAESRVRRPKGPDQRYSIVTRIDIAGAGALLDKWRYPMRITKGTVHVSRHEIILEGVEVQGVTGGYGKITGGYYPQGDAQGLWSPKIKFEADDFPIDPVLLSSLQPAQRRRINTLRIDGKVDVAAGELFRRDDGQIDYLAHAVVHDGAARPFAGGYRIDDLGAQLVLKRGSVGIDEVTGTHGSGTFKLTGKIDADAVELNLTADRLEFADPVLDLMPPEAGSLPQMRRIFEQRRPDGRFNAQFTYRRESGQPSDYALSLMPKQIEIDVRDQRVKLTDVDGTLLFSRLGMTVNDLRADFGGGKLDLKGFVSPGDNPTMDLTFSAQKDEFCPVTRAFVPETVLAALDELKLTAGYRIHQANLHITPEPGGDNRFTFECKAQLKDAAATIGLPVRELNGTVQLLAEGRTGEELPKLDMTFSADQARVSDRLITDVRFRARTEPLRKMLVVEGLEGDCYGGKIVGGGEVKLDEYRQYQVQLSAQNVALDPFLHPTEPGGEIDEAVLSAQLALRGVPKRDELRFGRGAFNVQDAEMYRTPLIMAVLHLVNLALPSSSSFDRASADFLIEGDDVMFESIRFDSSSLAMTGVGMMGYESKKLDLELTLNNPTALDFGPLTDWIKIIKDELIHIHVGGTLEKPKASLKPLKGIRRGWDSIFSGVREKLNQLNPLASRRKADDSASTSGQ